MSTAAPHADDESRWSGWMVRATRGDQASYAQLLREVGDVVEIYLRVRFGRIDVLEDCVQECLLAIHLARHTWDESRPFRPWMFTIVRHKTIDVLRQRRSRLLVERSQVPDAGGHRDPDHLLRFVLGIRVLENLSPDHREAVALTQYAGYSAAEAAAWLGITESAVKARLRRALISIRKQLEREALPA